MIINTGFYKPRPIRFLELWEHAGWKVKFYGISSPAERPEAKFLDIAKKIASETLPKPPLTDSRYGAAFVTIHQAEMFNQIIVDWWERVNELRHHVFKSMPDQPDYFQDITAGGEAFCIWELRVIGFEREAWIKAVLKNTDSSAAAGAAGIDDYLNFQLNEDA